MKIDEMEQKKLKTMSKNEHLSEEILVTLVSSQRILRPFILTFFSISLFLSAGCSQFSILPIELKLSKELYNQEVSHFVGPGGINHSFTVFELPEEVGIEIKKEGLKRLHSMRPSFIQKRLLFKKKKTYKDSTMVRPWRGPFKDWRPGPIPKEKRWLRRGRGFDKPWKPSLQTFYRSWLDDNTKDPFLKKIPDLYVTLFQEAIGSSQSFYSYGGYRGMYILIISLEQHKVYYLTRD